VFLHRFTEKHDVANTLFLINAGGYLTPFTRHKFSGRLDCQIRDHIGKWSEAVTVRIDRFQMAVNPALNSS